MKYNEYISKVKDLCIMIDSLLNIAYIRPEWKHILRTNGLYNVQLEDDVAIEYDEIQDVLEKEIAIYNGFSDTKKPILDWIFETVCLQANKAKKEEQ